MILYTFRVILSIVGMLMSSYSRHLDATNAVMYVIVTAEVVSLLNDARQLVKKGPVKYFKSIWNYTDLVGAGALLIAAIQGHLMGNPGFVESWGALGVMLKTFGTMDYLRSFPATGPLVRMLQVVRD